MSTATEIEEGLVSDFGLTMSVEPAFNYKKFVVFRATVVNLRYHLS